MSRLLSHFSRYAPVISGATLLLTSPFASAAKYVPPPAGPYQPELVVSEQPDANDSKSDRVYKFPSEDLFRGEAPAFNSSASNALPLNRSLPQSANSPAQQQGSPRKPGSTAYPTDQTSTTGAEIYPSNPWAAGKNWNRQVTPPGVMYPPVNQGWAQYGSPQYGYQQYGGQSAYPYGYNYQNYSNSGPLDNMTAPWKMMPMQPFFPGN